MVLNPPSSIPQTIAKSWVRMKTFPHKKLREKSSWKNLILWSFVPSGLAKSMIPWLSHYQSCLRFHLHFDVFFRMWLSTSATWASYHHYFCSRFVHCQNKSSKLFQFSSIDFCNFVHALCDQAAHLSKGIYFRPKSGENLLQYFLVWLRFLFSIFSSFFWN